MEEIIPDFDYEEILTDEVALEGLDGITLSALWIRIGNRPHFNMVLDSCVKNYFWEMCVRHSEFQFFELPEARGPLVILNRISSDDDEDVDRDTDETITDIYPVCILEGSNAYGSCSTYWTRVNVTKAVQNEGENGLAVSLSEAESRWGEKLVIVASFERRKKALLGDLWDPVWEFNNMQYVLLERIGRSRYHGEFTCGKNSLADIGTGAKNMFYIRRQLLIKGVICKQNYYLKGKEGYLRSVMLLHLTRFYVEHKSRMFILVEDMCKYLLERPGHMASLRNMMKAMKITKKDTFSKYIRKIAAVKLVPYHELKENGEIEDEKIICDNKLITVAVLYDHVNFDNLESILEGNMAKEEDEEDDSLDVEMDESVNKYSSVLSHQKFIKRRIPDCSNHVIDQPLLRQAYNLFNKLGTNGATMIQFGNLFGIPRLESRLICHNLKRLNLVDSTKRDVGRQRETVFVAKRYIHGSRKEIYEECEKLIDFLTVQDGGETEKSQSVGGEKSIETKLNKLIQQQEKGQMPSTSGKNTQTQRTLLEDIKMMLNTNLPGKIKASPLTVKALKRINVILQAVRKAKLVDSHVTLYKLIVNMEAEDCSGTMTLKSFQRILKRLNKEGYLRTIQNVITAGDKEKKILLISDNSLEPSDPLIVSALDQAKLKFHATPNVTSAEEKPVDLINCSISQLRGLYKKEEEHQPRVYSNQLGRSYGHEPKFIRCKLFHEFLCYLTFCYEGQDDIFVSPEHFDCDIKALPKIYHYDKGPSWKMFVTRLPTHYGWGEGWCLMSDALLRLPLSLLVRIVSYNFKIYGIEEYLNDPVKRNIPVCYLPLNLRNQLLSSRKYIHLVYECAQKLYYMGLLSFGPTEHKSKDMVFLFLHRKARVVDTTISRPGYHKVSDDIDYTIRNYYFDAIKQVQSYWLDLESVCRGTPLGSGYIPTNNEMMVVIEVLEKKLPIKPIQPSEQVEKEVDTGIAPGDQLGAGGLDSSCFSHLNRSWNWNQSKVKVKRLRATKNEKQPSSKSSAIVSVRWKDKSRIKFPINAKNRMARLVINKELLSMENEKKAANSGSAEAQHIKTNSAVELLQKSKKSKDFRQWKPRKTTRIRAPKYDEKDLIALSKVKTKRVNWHAKEDSLLLLCKVAYVLMFDNRKSGISCRWIRDYLHRHSDVSADKTTLSCNRRINYMLKNLQTGYHISVCVGESRQDKEISILCEDLHLFSPVTDKDIFKDRFDAIMTKLMAKFKSASFQFKSNTLTLPSTLEELHRQYDITFAKDYWAKSAVYADVENEDGILYYLAHSLILSAVAGFTSDEQRLSVQLYDVFKQFPDKLLMDALIQLKSCGIICCKKPKVRRKELCSLPVFGTLTFRLSIHYINMLRCKYPEEVFAQVNDTMHRLLSNGNEKQCNRQPIEIDQNGGYVMAIISLSATRKINFDVMIPDEIVTLGLPSVRKEDASIPTKSSEKRLGNDVQLVTDNDKELTGENNQNLDKEKTRENDQQTVFEKNKTHPAEKDSSVDEPPQKRLKLTGEEDEADATEAIAENLVEVESAHNKVAFKPASKSSRLALYMLRQDMEEIALRTVQHTQDYLIIKPCQINCTLNLSKRDANVVQTKTSSNQFKERYLPTTSILLRDIVTNYAEMGNSEDSIMEMTDIYNTISARGELGICYEDLNNWHMHKYTLTGKKSSTLLYHLTKMEAMNGVLKVGVSTVRYVAQIHVGRWQLRSFRLLHPENEQYQVSGIADENCSDPHDTDASKAKDKVEVCFIPKVWRRADGSLNTPVYNQLLTAIFGRIMSNPGVSFDKLYAHFKNVFTPFQLNELLDILFELGSVIRLQAKRSHKTSLFSSLPTYELIENGKGWSSSVCYESQVDGTQKLSSYLYDIV